MTVREQRSKSGSEPANDARLRVAFSEERIRLRVATMAHRINRDYSGRTVHLVGLLENSFVFVSDLVRQLRCDVTCHFLSAETHDRCLHGVPVRQIRYTPELNLRGLHVLMVDGVLETGVTWDFLLRSIEGQCPASVRTAALIEKIGDKKVGLSLDYVGFRTTKKSFLVGYGLGWSGRYQNLPYLAMIGEAGANKR